MAITASAQRITIGLALITAGVLFLADQLNGIPFGQSWPLILIVVGGSNLLVKPRSWVVSGGLTVAGVIFLLGSLGVLDVSFGILWPVLLLGLGAVILFGGRRRRPRVSRQQEFTGSVGTPDLDVSAIFAGGEQRIEDQNFRSGQASAIFGSADVDLRGSTLEGNEATLEATAVFGSLRIRVPNDWSVNVQAANSFGNIETKRVSPANPTGTLTILGSATFGSIEVTD